MEHAEKFYFVSLEALAAELGLPQAYLRRLAADGKIPSLNVSGRLRFNPSAVGDALTELSRKGGQL